MTLECLKGKEKPYTGRFIVTFHHFAIEVACVPVSLSLFYIYQINFSYNSACENRFHLFITLNDLSNRLW